MNFNMATLLIGLTFAASIYLMLNKSDRLWPIVAVIASGVQLLLAMGLMSLSLAKFRIDVILPALLVVAGVICWSKVSTKGTITAATIVSLIAAVELLGALRILS